jgi:DNA (cytosine-5)-methyltransferase 1
MPFDAALAPQAAKPKLKKALVADLFCGAGGSSSGAKKALEARGYEMQLVAMNHWQPAITTHSRNFPTARHYIADVNKARPHEIVPEGYLDLLMASPTCMFFSRARGGKPVHDQGRMDAWAVVNWISELRVKRLLVENVPEFLRWGPLDKKTGRPVKRREGEYFLAWVATLKALGMKVDYGVLNAADYGDATTRERFFLIGRSDGRRLSWPTPTHSRDGATDDVPDLLGHRPLKWKSARDHVIDWSIPGLSVFGRRKGLAPKTLDRIIAGGLKFKWPPQLIEALRLELLRQLVQTIQKNQTPLPKPRRCEKGAKPVQKRTGGKREQSRRETEKAQSNGAPRSTGEPMMTLTTGGASCEKRPGCARPAVVDGFLLNRHGDNGATRAHPLDEPVPTADGRGAGYLVEPALINLKGRSTAASVDAPAPTITANAGHLAVAEAVMNLAEPLIVRSDQTGGNGLNVRPTSDPIGTITGSYGGGMAVVEAFVLAQGSNGAPRDVAEPMPTIVTAGKTALVTGEPFIATVAHGSEPQDGGGDARRCRSTEEPLQTIQAGGGKFAKVDGFVLSQASGGAPRDVLDPLPTIPAGGAHALIAPYYGSGSGLTGKPVDQPLDSPTTKGRFGLVVGLTHTADKTRPPRSIDQPLPTITTARGGELALVMPVTHGDDAGRVRGPDDPLPTVTGAPRGELALIVAAFGERQGQEPRFHSVDGPVPAICASGRIQLACGLVAGEDFDVRFRMLDPRRELARAMSFSSEDVDYEFVGNKTQVTKMIGNAVPVEMACALVGALFER